MKMCGWAVGKSEGNFTSRESCIWSGPLNFILKRGILNYYSGQSGDIRWFHDKPVLGTIGNAFNSLMVNSKAVNLFLSAQPGISLERHFLRMWIQSTGILSDHFFSERMNIAMKCIYHLFAARIGALRVASATSSASSVLMVLLPCSGHTLR